MICGPQTSKQKGRREAGLSRVSIQSRSIPGDYRATPVEAIVDAGLHSMLVVAVAAESRERGRRHEGGLAEVVVLIFDLGGPTRREHVFEAGTDGVAIMVAAVERERLRHAADVKD